MGHRIIALLLIVCTGPLACAEPATTAAPFEKDIAAREAAYRAKPPPTPGIEFIGSSTFRRWSTLEADMAPLPVFNCAFGGSRVADVLAAVPRLVVPYKPRVLVYYCGDNDMGKTTADWQVPVQGFTDFVAAVRVTQPAVRIIYVAIKPSPKRWAMWPQVQQANAAVKAVCAADPALAFVDLAPVLLGADGQPRAELYVADQLHLAPAGYALATGLIKPAVERAWTAQ